MNKLKQSIINVHDAPNTQPGGVHGALFKLEYHALLGPSPIRKPPKARAPKFSSRKNNRRILEAI
jgi:hypothetical protein|tara:strand:- start:7784 stop:7978 length:195 start_codon:yes stop_codon:yes gene_type:complete